jgi:general secretion pathway protein D
MTGSNKNASIAIALAAALLASSCSLLPPSLRKQDPAVAPPAERSAPPPAPQVVQAPPPQTQQLPNRLFSGTGVFVNQNPPAPPPPPGPEEASLNFEALDVREVAKVILGDYLHESYTVHPQVAGTVTFRTIRPIPMRDLLPTLEMLLRQNGAAVVKEEGIYKILPVAQVRGSVSPQLGGGNRPLPPGFSVIVVPLKYVGARDMEKLLQPFAADNTIRIDEMRNLVIMAGSQRELRHLVDTVDLFDVDWLAGYSVGLFPIRSGDVKSMMQDLDKVLGATGQQNPLAGVMRIIPIERLNSLFVVTTQPRYLETARTWIERLDQAGATSGGSRFYVYQVRNGKAENLAQLVGDLFASRRTTTSAPTLAPGARPTEIRSTPFGQTQPSPQTTTTTVTPPAAASFQIPGASGTTSGEVRVIADKDTNSLLILASPSDYEVIESALRKLDVVPRQVLVEVALVEVALQDAATLGLGWFINARNNTTGQLGPGLPATPGAANPGPLNPGNLQLIQRTASGDIRAVLNMFGSDNKAKVLASPQVMVLDNQKAQIKIGDRISVQTQSQTVTGTTGGLVNSFQYLETGVLLAVTPRINSGGLVTLEVNQEVSSADPTTITEANPNPNVNSRSAQTTVVVASGETIVLGGLIREDNQRGTSGLPLLSKIPILGAAFGSQNFSAKRTELILVITPHIVSDATQAREATEELRRKMPSLHDLLPPPAKVHPAVTDVVPVPGSPAPGTVAPVQVVPGQPPVIPTPPRVMIPPPPPAPGQPGGPPLPPPAVVTPVPPAPAKAAPAPPAPPAPQPQNPR